MCRWWLKTNNQNASFVLQIYHKSINSIFTTYLHDDLIKSAQRINRNVHGTFNVSRGYNDMKESVGMIEMECNIVIKICRGRYRKGGRHKR